MDLQKTVSKALEKYREENGLSTYRLRIMERNKEPKPVAGINVTTLNLIQKKDYIPCRKVQLKLVEFLNIPHSVDSWGNITLK